MAGDKGAGEPSGGEKSSRSIDGGGGNEPNKRHKSTNSPLPPEHKFFIPLGAPDDLIPVGKIIEYESLHQYIDTYANEDPSTAARPLQTKVTADTILSDLYRMKAWYFYIPDIDDTVAVPRRNIMLKVTPLGDPSTAKLKNHAQFVDYGRVRLDKFKVYASHIVGNAPQWFVSEMASIRALKQKIQDCLQRNPAIHVSRAEALETRPWINQARQAHRTEREDEVY